MTELIQAGNLEVGDTFFTLGISAQTISGFEPTSDKVRFRTEKGAMSLSYEKWVYLYDGKDFPEYLKTLERAHQIEPRGRLRELINDESFRLLKKSKRVNMRVRVLKKDQYVVSYMGVEYRVTRSKYDGKFYIRIDFGYEVTNDFVGAIIGKHS